MEAPAIPVRRGLPLPAAAEYAGMSISWVRKAIYNGRLPARKLGVRTIVLIEDLDALLERAPRA